jgi:ComF family protein
MRDAILRVKFGRQAPLARSLGLYMKDHYSRFFPAGAFHSILPVPLHPTRLREREFNQCVLLARPLAAELGIPMNLRGVERVRHTLRQSASTQADRRKNLKGAFRVRRPEHIRGRSILLFDDVYTTGATLEELARTLLSAGARKVCGFTLARSPAPPFP